LKIKSNKYKLMSTFTQKEINIKKNEYKIFLQKEKEYKKKILKCEEKINKYEAKILQMKYKLQLLEEEIGTYENYF